MGIGVRFQDSSQRLINRYGRIRTYVQTVIAYDLNSQMTVDTETLYSIKMFKTDPKERETKFPNLVDKVAVVMMIAAKDLPVRPTVGDTIKEDYLGTEEVYQVVSVKANDSGDEVVSWRLVCSKS